MKKELKKNLQILSLLQRIELKIQNRTHYLFYNEEDITESDAMKIIKAKDFDNSHIILMTKEQYDTVFRDYE